MLRKTLALAMALASLAFVACDDDDGKKDSGTSVTTERGTETSDTGPVVVGGYTRQEKAMLIMIRNGPYSDAYDGESDARVVEVGHEVCTKLDSGTTLQAMVDTLQAKLDAAGSSDHEAEAVGYFLGAAVKNLCPEYSNDLQ